VNQRGGRKGRRRKRKAEVPIKMHLRRVFLRACKDDGVLRRAKPFVGAVQLKSGSPVPTQAFVPEALAGDALKHPAHTIFLRLGSAAVVGASEVALRCESNASQQLGGAPITAPQATCGS